MRTSPPNTASVRAQLFNHVAIDASSTIHNPIHYLSLFVEFTDSRLPKKEGRREKERGDLLFRGLWLLCNRERGREREKERRRRKEKPNTAQSSSSSLICVF
jgi:hypothetical protein